MNYGLISNTMFVYPGNNPALLLNQSLGRYVMMSGCWSQRDVPETGTQQDLHVSMFKNVDVSVCAKNLYIYDCAIPPQGGRGRILSWATHKMDTDKSDNKKAGS
jgi:hypothetical protein